MNPLVSIIIPTYNRAHFIGNALDSVITQTYNEWECIVVDDGSNDHTEELMDFYCLTDSRISFYKRPESKAGGASSCRNYGLKKAKGELIQFLDSDDLISPTKLEAQVQCYLENTEFTLLTGKWGGFRESRDLKSRFKYNYNSYKDFKQGLDLLNSFGHCNEYFPLHVYLTPMEVIKKAGNWNENLTNNDDAEFFTRVILNSIKVVFVPKAEAYYRYSGNAKLSNVDSKKKAESLIRSLKLIEGYMKDFGVPGKNKYVLNAKRYTLQQIEGKFPDLVDENYLFFKTVYPYYKRILKRMF